MAFAFALLNCLYLDPRVLFHLIFSPTVLLRRAVIEQLSGQLGIQPRSTHYSLEERV